MRWGRMGCRCYSLGDGGLDGNPPRLDTGVCVGVGIPVAVAVDVAVGANLELMNGGGGGKSYVRHITTPFTKFTTFLDIRLHRKFTKVKA